jgi:tRNA G37 N-methylase TrmD
MHSDYEVSVGHSVVSGGEVPALFSTGSFIKKNTGCLG